MRSDDRPARHADGSLVLDAVRHRWMTLLGVALGVTAAAMVLVYLTPSRYDAQAIVGFAPNAEAPVSVDEVRLGASQSAMSATSRAMLTATEDEAGVPAGTLVADDVRAELIPETGMIQLVVSDTDPRVAAALADALAERLVSTGELDLLDAEVVIGAEVPTSAAAPARSLYAMAGLLAGLGLGVCVVVGLEAWRPRVRGPAQLGRILEVPTVADLRRAARLSPPVRELRLAQLRLTRGQSAGKSKDEAQARLPELSVVGTSDVAPAAVRWVAEGLAGALSLVGHDVHVREVRPTDPNLSAGGPHEVRVAPVRPASSTATGLADDRAPQAAVVVVNELAPVSAVDQLRRELEAAGIGIVASALSREERGLPRIRRRLRFPAFLGAPGSPTAQRTT